MTDLDSDRSLCGVAAGDLPQVWVSFDGEHAVTSATAVPYLGYIVIAGTKPA